MKNGTKLILSMSFIVLFNYLGFGQAFTSGSRIIHVQEGYMPKSGTMTVYNNMSAYGGSDAGGGSVWDVRNSLYIDYSITQNYLLAAHFTLYQDLNNNDGLKESNSPVNDLSITLKAGSLGFASDYWYMAALLNVNIPLGESWTQNIPLEPYRGLGPNLTLMTAISYYSDNLFPEESFGFHTNIGFTTYFDKGKNQNPKEDLHYNITKSALDLKYAIGAKYPMSFIDLYGEFWGSAFVSEPDEYVLGRESFGYATLGISAKPLDFMKLDISGDFLAVGSGETSLAQNGSNLPNNGPVPDVNYAPWKVNVGLKFNILPLKTSYTIDPTRRYNISEQETQEIRNRIRIIEEDEQVTKDKVEILKTKRKDVESNLKQLKDLLKNLDEAPASGN